MKKFFHLIMLLTLVAVFGNSLQLHSNNSMMTLNNQTRAETTNLQSGISDRAITYDQVNDDTMVTNDLISNNGNTRGCPIIASQNKINIGNLSAIRITIRDDVLQNLDEDESFYVLGTTKENNDFVSDGNRQFITGKITDIMADGIYYLHIADKFNNNYNSYLEIGINNWQLKGDFDNHNFLVLANLLNVTLPENMKVPDKQKAKYWLTTYKNHADITFNQFVNNYGRGFDIQVTSLTQGYRNFLNPVTYTDPYTKESINQDKLINEINYYALNLINSIKDVSEKLNVTTINVVDKWSLDDYNKWINGYNDFMNRIKSELINSQVVFAGRGYASEDQIKDIFAKAFRLSENIYLKPIIWNKNLDNNYKQDIDYDQLKAQIISLMNEDFPEVIPSYDAALQASESNLNLHGYGITRLLEGQQPAQSKSEIANYQNDLSFHNWLQQKADDWFHDWQLKMGLGIGVPLFAILVTSGGAYWRHHYNKYAACGWRKKLRPIGWEPSRRISLSFNFWDAPKKKRYPFKGTDDFSSEKEQVKSEAKEIDKTETKENQNLQEKQLNQENEKK